MGNRHQPGLCRMLEVMMAAPDAHQIPAICNDVSYQISAIHSTSLWCVLVVTITTEIKLSTLYLPVLDGRYFGRRKKECMSAQEWRCIEVLRGFAVVFPGVLGTRRLDVVSQFRVLRRYLHSYRNAVGCAVSARNLWFFSRCLRLAVPDGSCAQDTLECVGIPKATRPTHLRAVAALIKSINRAHKKTGHPGPVFLCIPRQKTTWHEIRI